MGRFLSDDANCGRARAWVSQDLDAELSQIERLFLAAHVRRCGECAQFAEEVRGFGVEMIAVPETGAAAEHAASAGLISPDAVRRVHSSATT